jgi:protoporphyrinogen IX oxidase
MSNTTQTQDGKLAAKRAFAALLLFALFAGILFWMSPENLYLWFKALHVISVIAWMAGMFYLPRLFVYHADAPVGSAQSELFKIMERRLLRAIINPAMIFTWVFGLWIAWDGFRFMGGWLHVKIVAVIALSAFHGFLSKSVRLFANDQNQKSARYWRLMNEVPTVLMFIIVILVVVKPF